MGWIRWTGKTLEFVGKLAQMDSFERWAESQGEKIITDVGLRTGGYIFGLGKNQKAKGVVWDELQSLSKTSPELKAAIEDFVTRYPGMLYNLASKYSDLPHTSVDLCVVPQFLVNRDALIEVKKRLGNSQELANLKGGSSLREYFFQELVAQLSEAYTKEAGKAGPDRPLELADKWIVGFNPSYHWKGGDGHYFVYSNSLRTSQNATKDYKKDGKKQAAELLTKCLKWLGELPASEREAGNEVPLRSVSSPFVQKSASGKSNTSRDRNLETLSRACLLRCWQDTRSRSRSSTPFRLALATKLLADATAGGSLGREVN